MATVCLNVTVQISSVLFTLDVMAFAGLHVNVVFIEYNVTPNESLDEDEYRLLV